MALRGKDENKSKMDKEVRGGDIKGREVKWSNLTRVMTQTLRDYTDNHENLEFLEG